MSKGNGKALAVMEAPVVPKRVAVVGLGPSSKGYIEAADKAGDRFEKFDEVWTVNSYSSVIKHDMLFHMDDLRLQEARAEAGNIRIENMLKSLKRSDVPIMTSVEHPDYPKSTRFPLLEVVEKFKSLYFYTTPPYMVAYAMYIGVKDLYVYGMDYTWPGREEAEKGRGCMEYWLGMAHGHGVNVHVSGMSSLMNSHVNRNGHFECYGYDGYSIDVKVLENKQVEIKMTERPLPSAMQVEKAYSHLPKDKDVSVVPRLVDEGGVVA